MTTTVTAAVDAALRSALADLNRAYVALPPHQRDNLDVDVPGADEAVTAVLRSGDQVAALGAISDWRDAHLAQIAEASRSARCRCESAMVFPDERGEASRCARCGREAA